jgi:protein TonB
LSFAQCTKPVYPQTSLRNEETGTVGMMFLVGKGGVVKEKKIGRSSGFPEFDMAALNAIGMCVFKPATGKWRAR